VIDLFRRSGLTRSARVHREHGVDRERPGWAYTAVMPGTTFGVTLAVCLAAAAPTWAQLRLTMGDGYVTLSARDVTISQILAEWAKVGQTSIVNGDRVPGGPVTLELANLPEAQALDVILRSASGYLAAPRTIPVPSLSRYDRILVLPTSSPSRATTPPPASASRVPQAVPPAFQQRIAPDDQDDAPVPGGQEGPRRDPAFTAFPQPLAQPAGRPGPAQSTTPTSYPTPTAPVGVPVPGMIVQPPQPPPGSPAQLIFPQTPQPR